MAKKGKPRKPHEFKKRPMRDFTLYESKCNCEFTNSDDKAKHKKIYDQNSELIAKHNSEADEGLHTFWVSDGNCLAHLDSDTIKRQKCGFRYEKRKTSSQSTSNSPQSPADPEDILLMAAAPTSGSSCDISECSTNVDWRDYGVISSVKDQLKCGCCWAFTAVDAVEAEYAYNMYLSGLTPTFKNLSQQHLVDCCKDNCNCTGGIFTKAWRYWMTIPGVARLTNYPYKSADGVCKNTASMSCTPMKNYTLLPSGDESCMVKHLDMNPSIAACIDATRFGFMYYDSGIYTDTKCSKTAVNHAVLICGYGEENGIKYWLVKNTWGDYWGEDGFVRMKRDSNTCGIAYFCAAPIV